MCTDNPKTDRRVKINSEGLLSSYVYVMYKHEFLYRTNRISKR